MPRNPLAVVSAVAILLACGAGRGGPLSIPGVEEVYPFVPSWKGLTVLHIGDSHVSAGLLRGLARRLDTAGARYRPVCWVGSRARSWVVSGRLQALLRKHRPDVVVITLGTNAMRHRSPRRYAGWVEKLVRQVGGRTCYWLGPPPLLDDPRGFNEMLAEASPPCRYFDSRALGTPRRTDGRFHLTRAQGEDWAARVWSWMNDERPAPAGEAPRAL